MNVRSLALDLMRQSARPEVLTLMKMCDKGEQRCREWTGNHAVRLIKLILL